MKPQLNPVRIGEQFYLRRVDNNTYARTQTRDKRGFEWTAHAERASHWDTNGDARFAAATLGYELTPVFGHHPN